MSTNGVVARAEVAHAVRRIRGMHGVDRVENRLEFRADPAEFPGAQSPIPDLPRDPRPDLTLRRLSPSERAEGVALGGGLLLDGVRRGGLSGAALGICRTAHSVRGADQQAARRAIYAPRAPRARRDPDGSPSHDRAHKTAIVVAGLKYCHDSRRQEFRREE
jgi:hypothetical protein